jgi:hypothetical protein
MQKRLIAVPAALVAAVAVAASALSSARPVGPLPKGAVETVRAFAGATFTVTLPSPAFRGRTTWRVARGYDSRIVREIGEGTKPRGSVWVRFRAVGPGTTRIVYALTRGDAAHAYAARTFRVVVSKQTDAVCSRDLLPLTANAIGPAVTVAIAADTVKNRPQATAAAIASSDTARGPQVKAECGARVQARTIVVYITDRALLPSQSASQRVLFVGRTRAGYRVWERAR